MRFEITQNPSDNTFTYEVINESGTPLFVSDAFATREACTNSIENAVQALADPARYVTQSDGSLAVVSGEGAVLARSQSLPAGQSIEALINDSVQETRNTDQFQVSLTTTRSRRTTRQSELRTLSDEELAALYNFAVQSTSGLTGFELFQSDDNEQHYFHFNDAEGTALLFSRGFSTAGQRNKRLLSVIQSAARENRFEIKEEAGQFYFILKARNGQEIARSRNFPSRNDALDGLSFVHQTAPSYEDQYKKERKRRNTSGTDDYMLDVPSPENTPGFVGFKNPDTKRHYFHLNDANGAPVLYSQGYTSGRGRDNGIRSTIKNSINQAAFVPKEENGTYYFVILAGNRQEIARSRPFSTVVSRDEMIAFLQTWIRQYATDYDVSFESVTTSSTETFTLAGLPAPVEEASTSQGGVTDDYLLDVPSPTTDPGFVSFTNPDNDLHFFHLNDQQGTALLFSEGYTATRSRDNGIRSVLKNGMDENAYRTHEEGGLYYFTIHAKNRQEIARSRNFSSAAERDAAIGSSPIWLARFAGDHDVEVPASLAAALMASTSQGGVTDDYLLDVPSPTTDPGFVSFTNPDNDLHFFHLNDQQGTALLFSEGYTATRSRDNGIRSVLKNGMDENAYRTHEEGGLYYFTIHAKNRQEIARSRNFSSAAERDAAIGSSPIWLARFAGDHDVEVPASLAAALMASTSQGGVTDDYLLDVPSPTTDPGFVSFTNPDNDLHFFHLNDQQGTALLFSEGYTATRSRDNGIRSVLKNGMDENAYRTHEEGGLYYFTIHAKNRQEIARSRNFSSAADRDGMMAFLPGWLPNYASAYGVDHISSENDDDSSTSVEGGSSGVSTGTAVGAGAALGAGALLAGAGREAGSTEAEGDEAEGHLEEAGAQADGGTFISDSGFDAGSSTGSHDDDTTEIRGSDDAESSADASGSGAGTAVGAGAALGAGALLAGAGREAGSAEAEGDEAEGDEAEGHLEEAGAQADGGTFISDSGFDAGSSTGSHDDDTTEIRGSDDAESSADASGSGAGTAVGAGAALGAGALLAGAGREAGSAEAEGDEAEGDDAEGSSEHAASGPDVDAGATDDATGDTTTVPGDSSLEGSDEADPRFSEETVELTGDVPGGDGAAADAELATDDEEDEEAYAMAGDDDGGGGWMRILPWLIPLLLLLLIVPFLIRGCGVDDLPAPGVADSGDNATQQEVVADNTLSGDGTDGVNMEGSGSAGAAASGGAALAADSLEADATDTAALDEETATGSTRTVLGPDALALGFAAGSIEAQIADLISGSDRVLPASFVMDKVAFPTNSAKLNKGAYEQVDNLVKLLKAYPNIVFEFVGHIDGTEDDDSAREFMNGENITLSAVRARCLFKKFEEQSISSSQLDYSGLGSTQPIADNTTEANRQKNRRLELIVRTK